MHPMVQRLARTSAGNSNRDLLQLLRTDTTATDIIRSLPGVVRTDGSVPLHAILASSYITCLYKHFPEAFVRRLGADAGRVSSFWSQMLAKPEVAAAFAEHPSLSSVHGDKWRHIIPLALHEDAGPISKRMSANVISFNSVLGTGSEKVTHFLLATYAKRVGSGAFDAEQLWSLFLTDFEALRNGIDLPNDQGGVWRFVLLFIKADEQQRCDGYGLTHYNSPGENCSECLCDPIAPTQTCDGVRVSEQVSLLISKPILRESGSLVIHL